MAYNRERKHAMKKRAKKLRLRMTQRYSRSDPKLSIICYFSSSTVYETENAQKPYLTSTHKPRYREK